MKENEVEISFVIVSWNTREFLRNCIISLKAATAGLSSEVIVVDNASSDGSCEMILREFPDVILLREGQNSGFARANNRGIAASCGRYVCLVNSDVEVYPDSINILLDQMAGCDEIGILGPKVLNRDLSLQPSCRTFPTLRSTFIRALSLDTCFPGSRFFGDHFMTHWDYEDTREVQILSGCFWLIRRTALNEVGLLDGRFFMYGEDMDYCKRFHAKGWKVVFCDKARIIHYGGASSARDPVRFWVEMQRANLQYWTLHHGHVSVVAYYCCVLLHHVARVVGLLAVRLLGRPEGIDSKMKMVINRQGLQWMVSPSTVRMVLLGRIE